VFGYYFKYDLDAHRGTVKWREYVSTTGCEEKEAGKLEQGVENNSGKEKISINVR